MSKAPCLALQLNQKVATEFAKQQVSCGFTSLEFYLLHLLILAERTAKKVDPIVYLYILTTGDTVERYNALKSSGFKNDLKCVQYLLSLESSSLGLDLEQSEKPEMLLKAIHLKADDEGYDGQVETDCSYPVIKFNKLADIMQNKKKNEYQSKTTAVSYVKPSHLACFGAAWKYPGAFMAKCIDLAAQHKLEYAYMKNGEVMEIFNALSYHQPKENSVYGLFPIKCIVANNVAQMFLYENPVGEPETEIESLDALIGQLDTESRFVYCDGFEALSNTVATHGTRVHADGCFFWNDKYQMVGKDKRAGIWSRRCLQCRKMHSRMMAKQRLPEELMHITGTSHANIRHMSRGDLEDKCRKTTHELASLKQTNRRLLTMLNKKKSCALHSDANRTEDGELNEDDKGVKEANAQGRQDDDQNSDLGQDDVIKSDDGQDYLQSLLPVKPSESASTISLLPPKIKIVARKRCPTVKKVPEAIKVDNQEDRSKVELVETNLPSCADVDQKSVVDGTMFVGIEIKEEMDDYSDERYPNDIDQDIKEEIDFKPDSDNCLERPLLSPLADSDDVKIPLSDKKYIPICVLEEPDVTDEVDPTSTTTDATENCSECPKRYGSLLGLAIHRKYAHNKSDFICTACGQWFISQGILDYHATVHVNAVFTKSVICNGCGRPSRNSKVCQLHKRRMHSLYECVLCGYFGRSLASLEKHTSHCTAIRSNNFVCGLCFLVHRSMDLLVNHMALVHKRFKCLWCAQIFIDRKEYREHRMKFCPSNKTFASSTGTRPADLQCLECLKVFVNKAGLLTHLKHRHHMIVCRVCDLPIHYKELKNHSDSCKQKQEPPSVLSYVLPQPEFKCIKCVDPSKCDCHHKVPATVKQYTCENCSNVFTNFRKFKQHCRAVHDVIALAHFCHLCNKKVSSLKTHMLRHSKEKRDKCRFCDKVFVAKFRAINHEIAMHPQELQASGCKLPPAGNVGVRSKAYYQVCNLEDYFACYQCDFNDASRERVTEHLMMHYEKESLCKFCMILLEEATYLSHMKSHIPSVWKCKKCQFMIHSKMRKTHASCRESRFSYGSSYYGHNLKNGDSVFKCKFCDFKSIHYSKYVDNLKSHLLGVHKTSVEGASTHGCDQCDFIAMSKVGVKQHKDIKHSGSAACSVCGKVLGSAVSLNHHMSIIHTVVNKRRQCTICGKKVRNLSKHTLIHSNPRQFVCAVCGKGFNSKTNLFEHEKVHTGVKPYLCKTCGKCFSRRANYVIHTRTHMELRPFACEICSKRFVEKRVLERHLKTHLS